MPENQHRHLPDQPGYAPPVAASGPGPFESVPPIGGVPAPTTVGQFGYGQPGYQPASYANPGQVPAGYPHPGPVPAGFPPSGYPPPGHVAPGQIPTGYVSAAVPTHPPAVYPPPYGQLQGGAYGYAPVASVAERPTVWPVVVLTVLFGVFGLIPAYLRASNARRLGLSERPYWQAWAITFVCWIALVLVL